MNEMTLKVQEKYFDKIVGIDKTVKDDYDKAEAIHAVLISYGDAIQIIEDLDIVLPMTSFIAINYHLNIKSIYLNKLIVVDAGDDNGYSKGREISKLLNQCKEILDLINTIQSEHANYVKVVEKEEQA